MGAFAENATPRETTPASREALQLANKARRQKLEKAEKARAQKRRAFEEPSTFESMSEGGTRTFTQGPSRATLQRGRASQE